MAKKKWSELSDAQRVAVVVGGAIEVATTLYCVRDLVRRPASAVTGPKALWAAALVVQPFGPGAYLRWGRKG